MRKGEQNERSAMKVGFESSYEGVPPWDIGKPQPELVRLEDSGQLKGEILDVGCGTGENALFLASRGHPVWGVDSAPTAIAKARQKAGERTLTVRFEVADALHLEKLEKVFDTVIDSGLFHVFSDEDRSRFSSSLRSALKPGGTYIFICFSEEEPGTWGPRRVTQKEIRETFREGWQVLEMRPAHFETNFDEPEVKAWLAVLKRL